MASPAQAHLRHGSELAADGSFGSPDGLDDGLDRAEVFDPDGVEQDGDLVSGMGEIDENAPNEADFAETMRIVEAQESIQVTANSGALSGLDNEARQPEEGSAPEDGKPQGSASESGNLKQERPDSGDRACRGSLAATDSKREKRRRRQKDRRAVQRMVEEKLKAGCCSLEEIVMSALALPLSGDRGP